MTYTLDIPIAAVFLLFFVGGFIAGFAILYMLMDYARMRVEHAERYGRIGVRKPNFIKPSEMTDNWSGAVPQSRKAPPKPMHPHK